MKTIKLSGLLFAQVDDEDYEELKKYKWSAKKAPNTYYAVRHDKDYRGKKICVSMQRTILLNHGIFIDTDKEIDHKDRNGFNNQKSNLRAATHAENMANRTSHRNSTSKHLGVCLQIQKYKDKEYKYWVAQIGKGTTQFLGSFKSEVEAAIAYNEAAKKAYGEFANLNKIEQTA